MIVKTLLSFIAVLMFVMVLLYCEYKCNLRNHKLQLEEKNKELEQTKKQLAKYGTIIGSYKKKKIKAQLKAEENNLS